MKTHPFTQCDRCGSPDTAQFHIDVMGRCDRVCVMCLTEDELYEMTFGREQ